MKTAECLTVLGALAQETRLAVFRLLVETGPDGMTVGEIVTSVGTRPATLSFHLKELTHARLIEARQAGRFIHYSANFSRMDDLLSFLTDNCCHGDPSQCANWGLRHTATPSSPHGKAARARQHTARKGVAAHGS